VILCNSGGDAGSGQSAYKIAPQGEPAFVMTNGGAHPVCGQLARAFNATSYGTKVESDQLARAGTKMRRKNLFWIVGTTMLAAGLVSPTQADEVAEFYANKQVPFIVPTSVGGGFDLYSRVIVVFMAKYIPGRPTIIVQNMPGAGGVRAANYVFNVAPKDGSVFGMALSNIPLSEALEPENVRYRSSKFSWIGTITPETEILAVWRDTGVLTIDDARKTELTIGATGKLGTLGLNASVVKALLGTKFKIVYGYPAGNEVNMAMDRKEVQGRTNQWTSWKSQRPDWIKENKLSYLLQIGPREPELPNVPSLIDLVKTPGEKAMVRLLQSNQLLGRSLYAPPGVPPARLAALREAFDKTMRDPEFLSRMKTLSLDVNPRPASALQADLDETMDKADDAARDMRKALNL
jgi:tripartite-type tricarboxylate transporter receptor subunit TctC